MNLGQIMDLLSFSFPKMAPQQIFPVLQDVYRRFCVDSQILRGTATVTTNGTATGFAVSGLYLVRKVEKAGVELRHVMSAMKDEECWALEVPGEIAIFISGGGEAPRQAIASGNSYVVSYIKNGGAFASVDAIRSATPAFDDQFHMALVHGTRAELFASQEPMDVNRSLQARGEYEALLRAAKSLAGRRAISTRGVSIKPPNFFTRRRT